MCVYYLASDFVCNSQVSEEYYDRQDQNWKEG